MANFLIMKSIVSFLDDFGVSLSQLKRFNGPVIDPECLLKIAVALKIILLFYPFQATLYVFVYYYFHLYGLHAFQDNLELQSTLSF